VKRNLIFGAILLVLLVPLTNASAAPPPTLSFAVDCPNTATTFAYTADYSKHHGLKRLVFDNQCRQYVTFELVPSRGSSFKRLKGIVAPGFNGRLNHKELQLVGALGYPQTSIGIDNVTAATSDYHVYCDSVIPPSYLIEADGTIILNPCGT
jgi:hypothetical protein